VWNENGLAETDSHVKVLENSSLRQRNWMASTVSSPSWRGWHGARSKSA
jgi:hypothetical protein